MKLNRLFLLWKFEVTKIKFVIFIYILIPCPISVLPSPLPSKHVMKGELDYLCSYHNSVANF